MYQGPESTANILSALLPDAELEEQGKGCVICHMGKWTNSPFDVEVHLVPKPVLSPECLTISPDLSKMIFRCLTLPWEGKIFVHRAGSFVAGTE